jgi:hypothetical protein
MASLEVVRHRLLDLHKTLVDGERREHEKALGRLTDGEFLDALIKDPAFAWLGPLTGLIVRLDELVENEDAAPPGAEQNYVKAIRELLAPKAVTAEFHRRYADFLQRSPEVVVAHGEVMRALKSS